MPTTPANSISPQQILSTLVAHRRWWIVPAIVGFALAAVYSVVTPRRWKATQGVLIRPAVAGLTEERLGKFSDLSEMKTLQETILELARSQSVVTATLTKLGPPQSMFTNASWPSPQDVADFREDLIMTPPGGAEFGKTEVFYLGYTDHDRERAARCVSILRQELETRLKSLRDERAQSMIDELSNGVAQAEAKLDVATGQLAKFEASVGSQLADLRSIESPLGGQSQNTQQIIALESELRATSEAQLKNEKLLEILTAAVANPAVIVATPSSLLQSQPGLERVKQGLIDAQLNTARLQGTRTVDHPFVKAALEAEQQIRRQLLGEVAVARRGVELELELATGRRDSLVAQIATARQSLTTLAGLRAPYAQRLAAVENQTRLVDAASKRLADAQVTQAGTQSASLLARIDEVEQGVRPVGPGRTTTAAAGGLAGLLLGLGVTFVVFGATGNADSKVVPTWTTVERFEFSPPPATAKPVREAALFVPTTFVADAYAST